MIETLDQVDLSASRRSALQRRLAVASLLWPVLIVVLLYGEWLLATWSLGHTPRPSLDDPAYIPGSRWIHMLAVVAVLGALPASVMAIVFNTIAHELHEPTILRGFLRLALVVVSWGALVALVLWDPGSVIFWWMD